MNETILLVDDDMLVVSALQRSLCRTYRIEIAAGAGCPRCHPPEQIRSRGLRSPNARHEWLELLANVKQLSADTVRILLTGQADLDAAIAAVNEGNVFRFLTKPCPQATLCKTLDAALEQHRLQVAEKEVLRETLTGTVAILVDILSAIQPVAFGRASRIRQHVHLLAAELHLPDSWEFEAAAMLSQIGCISVDPRVLKKYYAGEELEEPDRRHLLAQASVGRNLLHRVLRLQVVAQMIERQYQNWQSCSKSDAQADLIAMGAQMLRAALEFDRLTGAGKSAVEALAAMRRAESEYHPDVVAALDRLKDKLPQRTGSGEMSDEYIPLNAQQLIFWPIADQVLRSLRNQSPV
jgi:response regulator RpfG family c-di-GMP phosphodiesterase